MLRRFLSSRFISSSSNSSNSSNANSHRNISSIIHSINTRVVTTAAGAAITTRRAPTSIAAPRIRPLLRPLLRLPPMLPLPLPLPAVPMPSTARTPRRMRMVIQTRMQANVSAAAAAQRPNTRSVQSNSRRSSRNNSIRASCVATPTWTRCRRSTSRLTMARLCERLMKAER